MLDTQDCLQNHIKNAKTTRFLYSQPSTLPTNAPEKFYVSMTFGLSFMVSSVAPTRSSIFYEYFIIKIGNRNLKVSSRSRKFESKSSAVYIQMTITFDPLDRFQKIEFGRQNRQ